MARQAGVDAVVSNSTGVAVCDVDNDGYQDLYVAAQGRRGDERDFSAARADPGLRDAVVDRLFLNNGDGTFKDVTASAFGDAANTRTGVSPGCADVDLDGWLDIFVANRSDVDQIHPDRPTKGNANVLYRNNGDLTFSEIAADAGVRGEQVTTWASLFFDYDSDGDPDLWAANDGGRLNVYRNDTRPGAVAFTDVARAMGIDKVGSWMGFALGDYDGDVDLDVFVTNLGYHPRMQQPQMSLVVTGQACHISQQYEWSTCDHFLLRNDGVATVPRLGSVGLFADVAPATFVQPSRLIPPLSIDPLRINPSWQVPTGLAAYDFGFGAVFFDYENDGDQDLYWLGSTIGRGEGLGGHIFPSAGRMLVGDGRGSFQDLTIEAHLLDIQNVDYSILDRRAPGFDPVRQRLLPDLHENGKGLAKGDLNGDGFTDLIATNSSGGILVDGETQFAKGPIFVWINPGGEDHWITLRLRGRMAIDGAGSNADGIGARVFVTARVSEGPEQDPGRGGPGKLQLRLHEQHCPELRPGRSGGGGLHHSLLAKRRPPGAPGHTRRSGRHHRRAGALTPGVFYGSYWMEKTACTLKRSSSSPPLMEVAGAAAVLAMRASSPKPLGTGAPAPTSPMDRRSPTATPVRLAKWSALATASRTASCRSWAMNGSGSSTLKLTPSIRVLSPPASATSSMMAPTASTSRILIPAMLLTV